MSNGGRRVYGVMPSRSAWAGPWCTVVCKIWEVKWEFAGGGSRFELMGARGSCELREPQCFGGYSGERKFPESEFYQVQLRKQTSDETKFKT